MAAQRVIACWVIYLFGLFHYWEDGKKHICLESAVFGQLTHLEENHIGMLALQV